MLSSKPQPHLRDNNRKAPRTGIDQSPAAHDAPVEHAEPGPAAGANVAERSARLRSLRNLPKHLGIRGISYGGTAAVVTNMALVMGLDAAMAGRTAIISALLVIAIADNLTDSLSIHIYQESEALESGKAFITTLTNYGARLLVSLSFLPIVLLPVSNALVVTFAITWGMLLLGAITYALARKRHAAVAPELVKHISVALLAILASRLIGTYISHILR